MKEWVDPSLYENESDGGHAVLLTSYTKDHLKLLNSWGSSWADSGFFRIEDEKVLGLEYYHIYWTLEDLKDSEK